MTTETPSLQEPSDATRLSDHALTARVHALAAAERHTTAQLIAALAEFDARRLYLGDGCSSLFTYCTQVLHLSEHAAYGRIEAARAARRFPVILDLLQAGDVTLTAIGLLAPHLTPENHRTVLDWARHKSKREVEHLVVALRPLPDVPATVRKLPAPRSDSRVLGTVADGSLEGPSGSAAADRDRHGDGGSPPFESEAKSQLCPGGSQDPACARPHAVVAPLAPERYKIQFTVGRETYDRLRRAQDLLRHSVPDGNLTTLFDRALRLLVENLERRKLAAATRPRSRSVEDAPASTPSARPRHIPAAMRREVWRRDGGQCAFIGRHGRCHERGWLEFHHVVPYAMGGETIVGNLQLRCRAHNAYEAEVAFGTWEVGMLVDPAERGW